MLGEQQDAGGLLVEAVDENRAVLLLAVDAEQQAVDMPALSRAALHRDAGGLVQGHHVTVLIDDEGFEEGLVPGAGAGRVMRLRRHRLCAEDRQADFVARLEARAGFRPGAVDADLARAQHLFDLALGQLNAPLDPAVKARAGLLMGDGFGDDLATHAKIRLAIQRPRASAATLSTTERPA